MCVCGAVAVFPNLPTSQPPKNASGAGRSTRTARPQGNAQYPEDKPRKGLLEAWECPQLPPKAPKPFWLKHAFNKPLVYLS